MKCLLDHERRIHPIGLRGMDLEPVYFVGMMAVVAVVVGNLEVGMFEFEVFVVGTMAVLVGNVAVAVQVVMGTIEVVVVGIVDLPKNEKLQMVWLDSWFSLFECAKLRVQCFVVREISALHLVQYDCDIRKFYR